MIKEEGISAIIITLNEEKNLQRCISSVLDVADEVIVLDSGSTDKTKSIATDMGAAVKEIQWRGYAGTKNLGAELAAYNYILSIDADEELGHELREAISAEKTQGLSGAYSFNRRNFYLGKWIKTSGWYPDHKVRLYPSDQAAWKGDYVHEQLVLDEGTSVTHLNGEFNHYSITSIEHHKTTIRKYASLAAQREFDSNKRVSIVKAILRTLTTFIKLYIIKLGFMQGRRGWLIARYSAWSKWLRYKELQNLKKQA